MLDVPPADAADVTVRAGPDAPPVTARPVEEIVPAPGSRRARPVGHLVPLEAGVVQRLVGHHVAARENVVVRHRQGAGPPPAPPPGGPARTSSSGIGRSPRRPCPASRVPGSTMREYADTWSAPDSIAASSEVCQSSSVSPGVP